MIVGIVELYCGQSGKKGFYNSQEVGIARAMKNRGYTSIIFYPDLKIETLKEEMLEKDIKIVYCPAKAIGVHSFYDWKILLKYTVDIVQIGGDNQLFVPNLVSFCRKHHIRYYNYIGTIESDSSNKLKKCIFKMLFKRNLNIYKHSKCFVKTDYVYNSLVHFGLSDLEMMPVGLDVSIIPNMSMTIEKTKEELHIPLEKQVITFVGRIDSYKRPLELIKLMKDLDNQYYFLIIGSGDMNEEFQTALDGINDNYYQWIKQIPNTDIHKYYYISNYFVNFNNKEIFGMSILEAMYHGCTVIANHAPGPDMIIEDKVSGFLVDKTEDVIHLICQGSKIHKAVARDRILNCFVWDKTIEVVCSYINANQPILQ